jgi:thioredoxin 1
MFVDDTQGTDLRRAAVDQLHGPVVLEFGAEWCGHCAAIRPHLKALLREFSQVQHIPIEDGKSKPLGRSFRVKLWPTLVFLRDGQVIRQEVRPSRLEMREGLLAITAGDASES